MKMHVKRDRNDRNSQKQNEDKVLEALGLRRIHPSSNVNTTAAKRLCVNRDTDVNVLQNLGLERIELSRKNNTENSNHRRARSERRRGANGNNMAKRVTASNKRKSKLSGNYKITDFLHCKMNDVKTTTASKTDASNVGNKAENKRKASKKRQQQQRFSSDESVEYDQQHEDNCFPTSEEDEIADADGERADDFEFVKVERNRPPSSTNSDEESGSRSSSNNGKRRKKDRSCTISCRICSKAFKDAAALKKHHDEIHMSQKPYCCSKCDSRFVGLDELVAHTRLHAGKMPYTCKTCKENFVVKAEYKEHLQVHELKKVPSVKKISCEECGKSFSKTCDLERHKRVHTGDKPFACMICNKRFQQAHNLTKHLLIHTREKQFQCEICNKVFGRSDVLTRHMLIHSVNKPFSCNFCEKSFNRNAQLTAHVERHHPQKIDNVE